MTGSSRTYWLVPVSLHSSERERRALNPPSIAVPSNDEFLVSEQPSAFIIKSGDPSYLPEIQTYYSPLYQKYPSRAGSPSIETGRVDLKCGMLDFEREMNEASRSVR